MVNAVNTLKNAPGVIAKLAAEMLEDNLQFCKTIDKADESDYNGKNGYNAGDTIYISKPARFIPGTSADVTSTIQDVVEEKVALTLDIRRVVPIALTSAEIATDMALKSWTNRILKPAVSSIAQYVEQTCLDRAKAAVYNAVGTPGTTVFDTDTMLSAGQKLNEFLAPMSDNKYALLNPAAMRSAVNARKGLFQSSEEVAKQYKKGYMGTADGFDYLANNLMPSLTHGVDVVFAVEASVVTITNGMSTLGVDGVTSGATIKAGTTFTIASCYAVHPITKQTLPYLQQFVVTADVTETSGNSVTLAIAPSIYYTSTDSRRNVSTAPVDEDACVTLGSASTTYGQNLVYAQSAFRMASVPLVMPDGLDMAAQETYKGITVRVIRDYDVLTDKLIMRIDFLGGIAAVRPEWGVRIYS